MAQTALLAQQREVRGQVTPQTQAQHDVFKLLNKVKAQSAHVRSCSFSRLLVFMVSEERSTLESNVSRGLEHSAALNSVISGLSECIALICPFPCRVKLSRPLARPPLVGSCM
ncbi:unnamed protein product [Lota lota]